MAQPQPMPPPVTRRRVLLVDDERDILDSLKMLLENAIPEVECVTADSGAQALSMLRPSGSPGNTGEAQGVELIVSDFKMPGMNGLAFLEQARAIAPDVPRVMMTAFPHLEVAVAAINEARVEIFLTKPMDPDKFIQVVRDTLAAKAKAAA